MKRVKGKMGQVRLTTTREATLLREAINCRIDDLRRKIGRCAGSLYPAVMEGQIAELERLFEKLAGYPV